MGVSRGDPRAPTPTLTETIRERVRTRMRECPACGRPLLSLRAAGTEAGVPFNSLSRFLRGRSVGSDTLDRLSAWLDRS